MAGPCAELNFNGHGMDRAAAFLRECKNGDGERVQVRLDSLNLTSAERDRVFAELLESTWRTVCENEGWAATQKLAAALLADNRLEYAQVEAILSPYRLKLR